MLTEDQKTQISEYVGTFQKKVNEYSKIKSELDKCEANIQTKMKELSKVAKEERQIETAMEVLYGQAKKSSKAREIEEEIANWEDASRKYRNELNQLKTDLMGLLRSLPIPADLENLQQHESEISFLYFEKVKLGNDVINAILDLFRQEPPLVFDDVTILPDRVTVKNVSERQEAIQKLVEAIQTFRMRADNLSESYEKIDALIERLTNSKLYSNILKTLAEKGKLTAQEIANILNVEERKVYDSCYNLTRNNWSPNPIEKTPSGEWKLTITGEILINRLFERFQDTKTRSINEESR